MNIKQQILSYSGINVLNAAVPFLLLPVLTTYLRPEDYGLLSLIQLLMLMSLPLVSMNAFGLLTIEYSSLSYENFRLLLGTIIWVSLLGFLLLECLFYLFTPLIIDYFHIPLDLILFIPLFVLLQVIPTIVPLIFQAKKEPINFGKYKIAMTITNLILSLLFVVVLTYGWQGRLYGIIGAFFIFTIIGVFVLLHLNLLIFTYDKKTLRQVLSFGIPLIPHSVAGIVLSMSDRIFLANMIDDNAVGIYSIAFQVSSVIAILTSSINQAWAPNLYERLNKNPTILEKVSIVKTTYKIIVIMIVLALGFTLIVPYIYKYFINVSYANSLIYVNYIVLAFLFQGFYFMVTNYILYSKKTKVLSYITLLSVILLALCNYLLIPIFGIFGSVYSMIIVWFLQFVATFYISNKVYPMPWRLSNV